MSEDDFDFAIVTSVLIVVASGAVFVTAATFMVTAFSTYFNAEYGSSGGEFDAVTSTSEAGKAVGGMSALVSSFGGGHGIDGPLPFGVNK